MTVTVYHELPAESLEEEDPKSMQAQYNDAIETGSTMRPIFSLPRILPPSYNENVQCPADLTRALDFSPRRTRLSKPVAIPSTMAGLGSPFLRYYAPVLEHYDLPRPVFLQHLEKLNRIIADHTPVQILKLTGTSVDAAPWEIVQSVGNAVSIAASGGIYAFSRGQMDACLGELNQDVFNPRGLRLDIVTTQALARLTGIPVLMADGMLDEAARLSDQLEPRGTDVSNQQRILETLRPWLEELEIDETGQEALEEPCSLNDRVHQTQAKLSEQLERQRKKMQKDFDKQSHKLDEDEIKAKRKEKDAKREKKLARIGIEREKILQDYKQDMARVDRLIMNDNKEEKELRKWKWLLIRHVEGDGRMITDSGLED